MHVLVLCAACDTGVGNNGTADILTIPLELKPLNISITDSNNNPIPYIDVALVGSHMLFKLKFTNPNPVAVTIPTPYLPNGSQMYLNDTFSDQNWLFYQAGVDSIFTVDRVYEYFESDNPGVGAISDRFSKTSNADDCLNTKSILPGGSCAFYAYAYNNGLSYAKDRSIFTYPIAYFIKSVDGRQSLTVQQCSYLYSYGDDNVRYDCSNEKKQGYVNQFIIYKLNPINTGVTNLSLGTFRGKPSPGISKNGNWFYICQRILRVPLAYILCDKYAMSYQSNVLTKASDITSSIEMIDQISGGNTIEEIYPSLDGSSAWIALYNKINGYSLVYTESPTQSYWQYCLNNTPCVPFINTTSNVAGTPGLRGQDDSFWWNTEVGSDVYVPRLNTFVETNAIAGGIDASGTVINFDTCFRPTSNPAKYTRQKLLNYTLPNYGAKYVSMNNSVYLEMPIYDFVDTQGNSLRAINAFFRVHTENNLCEIQLDDYTINVTGETSKQYKISSMYYGQTTGNFSVMPISNVYFGK